MHVPGAYYHVTLRGNHQQPIFGTDEDRDVFGEILAEGLRRFEAQAHAYCWMTNHVHLLAQIGDAPLGRLMHNVATRYARRFQKSIPTTGHLFERRYHAELIDSDDYLLGVVCYIHRNPVEAGMVQDAAQYPWSSHGAYLGSEAPAWLTTRAVLQVLSEDPSGAHDAYRALMQAPAAADADAAVIRLPQADACGTPGVCQHTRQSASPTARDTATLDAIIERVCRQEGISPDILNSPLRTRRLTELRVAIATAAVRSQVATLTEIAMRFDRNVASVSRMLQRRR